MFVVTHYGMAVWVWERGREGRGKGGKGEKEKGERKGKEKEGKRRKEMTRPPCTLLRLEQQP